MIALYLASSAERSGKTTIAAAIAKHLLAQNKKVGFFKPRLNAGEDEDASLMKRLLGLAEPVEILSPSFADETTLRNGFRSGFAGAATGKEVVIIEGIAGRTNLTGDIAAMLEARVLGIEAFPRGPADIGASYGSLGKRLIGTILNKVPRNRLARARTEMANAGVKAIGVIPEDRALLALTVAELANGIHGNIVSTGDMSALVENVLLGAMSPDHGPEYYSRKENKAAIIRSGRPDMQLAALESSTRCLVLAGKEGPIPMVLRRAEQKGVPIVSVEDSVASVVAGLEEATQHAGFSLAKASLATTLVAAQLDLDSVTRNLGLV